MSSEKVLRNLEAAATGLHGVARLQPRQGTAAAQHEKQESKSQFTCDRRSYACIRVFCATVILESQVENL